MKMENKVLIKLYVPELDEIYELFIPVNEIMWKIVKLITKSIYDLSFGTFPTNKTYVLMNKNTGYIYKMDEIIIKTDIYELGTQRTRSIAS